MLLRWVVYMKVKLFALCALLALVFSACNMDDDDEEEAITEYTLSDLYGTEYVGNMSNTVSMVFTIKDEDTLHFTVQNSTKSEPTIDKDYYYIFVKNGTNDYTTYWYADEDAASLDSTSDHSKATQYLHIGINSLSALSVQSAMGTSTLEKK